MKLHLPTKILTALVAAMATCAYAEDYTLAEDTTLTPSGMVDSSVSYTSADSNSKVDLTITGATTTIYHLNSAGESAVFDGLDTFSLSNNNAVTDESGLIRGNENSGGRYIIFSVIQ